MEFLPDIFFIIPGSNVGLKLKEMYKILVKTVDEQERDCRQHWEINS